MNDSQPAYDAEKIAADLLSSYYCSPPALASVPGRSTLLIGSRGSGKTMLLRTMRHEYPGLAIYGDLGRKVLSAVSADTGTAGLSFESIEPALEGPLQDKSVALLAVWLAVQCRRRKLEFSENLLKRILPEELRSGSENAPSYLEWIEDQIFD